MTENDKGQGKTIMVKTQSHREGVHLMKSWHLIYWYLRIRKNWKSYTKGLLTNTITSKMISQSKLFFICERYVIGSK